MDPLPHTTGRSGFIYLQVERTSCFRRRKRWDRLFGVLREDALLLYSSPTSPHPLRSVSLWAAACLFPQAPKVDRAHALQLETPTDSLFLAADTPNEIRMWALEIQKAAIYASGGSLGQLHSAPVAPLPTGPEATPRSVAQPASAAASPLANHDGLSLARYTRVLHRLESSESLRFTHSSSDVASILAPYSRVRRMARKRMENERMEERRRYEDEMMRRTSSLPSPAAAASSSSSSGVSEPIPLQFDVPSLGTLRLSSTLVELRRAADGQFEGEMSVANTGDYPIAIRIGDEGSDRWLQTNTPALLLPHTACVLNLRTIPTKTAAPATSIPPNPLSPTPAASPSAPPLPQNLPLVLKPCSASETRSPALSFFLRKDLQPTHRIGEKIEIRLREEKASKRADKT